MNILQVVPHYHPASRFGGPLKVAYGLSNALTELGHNVTVCTTNLADEHNDLDVPIDSPVDVDDATVFYEPTIYSRYWGYSPKLKKRIEKEISNADLVLVHAHFQYANLIGAKIARQHKKPYVIFPHSSLTSHGISHKSGLLKKAYLSLLEKQNMRNALFIAFNAPEEKDGSLHSELGEVIPNGIAAGDFSNRPAVGSFRKSHGLESKTILLFLGRLDVQQKGLDFLLPAFAEVSKNDPNLHLVLAGPDEDGGEQFLKETIAELDIEGSVSIVGMVTGQEKIGLLQDSDGFVMSSRFEGMSIALLEALYFGLPIFVTENVGMSRELRETQTSLVVSADLEGVREGMESIAKPQTRDELRGLGTKLIEAKYTWPAIAEHLLKTVESKIGGNVGNE
jgi:glycosyltransferase involved in cell wall biosynthesis